MQRAARVSAMPDTYARKPKVTRVREIFDNQISGIRVAIESVGKGSLPLIGGWEKLFPGFDDRE